MYKGKKKFLGVSRRQKLDQCTEIPERQVFFFWNVIIFSFAVYTEEHDYALIQIHNILRILCYYFSKYILTCEVQLLLSSVIGEDNCSIFLK